MKFSSQEEYGLRCLLQIARRGPDGSMTIPEISKAEALTTTHVAKLLMLLRRDGFLTSTRGQQGGYMLARPANQIFVGEVLESLGGKLYDSDFCSKHAGESALCTQAVDCSVRSLWQVLQKAVDEVVDRITIADLIEPPKLSNVTFTTIPRRMTGIG